MSAEILFDTTERRLTDKSVTKYGSIQKEFEKAETKSIPKYENSSGEAQGSASEGTKSSLTRSLNRKIDYHIKLESNEIIIQVRDGETGEVIRQIPQEDFVRLVDRISEFNKNILNETA